jgi:L-iditol 2-dehydrogenase
VPQETYFRDITIHHAYSCGPDDSAAAIQIIRSGRIRAEKVISNFISLDELPDAYGKMKRAELLKPMVVFPS